MFYAPSAPVLFIFGLSIERPILDHHAKAHIHEIRRISPWNPADFMKSVKSGGFHPWNPADFMKSARFHEIREIWRISWNPWNPADFMKSGRFHPWNPVDFTHEIRRISWNPADFTDFMKSGGFHMRISWNPADFMWNRKTSCKEL